MYREVHKQTRMKCSAVIGKKDKQGKHEVMKMIEPLITEEELRHHRYLEGIAEGRAEGIEQGIEKGQKENSIEVAKNMLKERFSIKVISRVTNLPVEEIKKIQL